MNDTVYDENNNINQTQEQVQQPTPQPQPQPQAQQPSNPGIPGSIPTVQNTYNYLAIGPQGQLYVYDLNIGSWGIAPPEYMEKLVMSCGIPQNVLTAIKNMRSF